LTSASTISPKLPVILLQSAVEQDDQEHSCQLPAIAHDDLGRPPAIAGKT
jgi:hypothetical protein